MSNQPPTLESERDEQQNTNAVVPIGPRRKVKAGEWDNTRRFNVKTFEGLTTVVEWMPPNSPPDFEPLRAEIRLNVISSEDLTQYNRALDDARFRAGRVSFLTDKLARCEDVGDLEDLEGDPGDDEAMDLREQIRELQARPDAMHININSILIPTVVRWNADTEDGRQIPLEPVAVKEHIGLTAVNGLSKVIIQAINGELKKNQSRSNKRRGR